MVMLHIGYTGPLLEVEWILIIHNYYSLYCVLGFSLAKSLQIK
jgi:hypothetical protein